MCRSSVFLCCVSVSGAPSSSWAQEALWQLCRKSVGASPLLYKKLVQVPAEASLQLHKFCSSPLLEASSQPPQSLQSWLWADHHPGAPLPLWEAICRGEGRCLCCQRQQSVRRCSAFRVRSGMEITPLHHSRTGRGRAAPRCAAVLEKG